METTVSLPGLIDKFPEDLAYINLQEMYESNVLRFDNSNFQPMTIAQRIRERPFKYNTRPARTAAM